jgi:hypothetical protein
MTLSIIRNLHINNNGKKFVTSFVNSVPHFQIIFIG